jgi:hypothetical protein
MKDSQTPETLSPPERTSSSSKHKNFLPIFSPIRVWSQAEYRNQDTGIFIGISGIWE